MRVQITHLKAPWPHGAVVGDVLELVSVPGWALGKCEPAPDGAEVTIEMPEVVAPEESGQADQQAAAMARHFREQAQAAIDKAAEAHALEVAQLQAQVQAQAGELEALLLSKAEGDAQIADLQAKLEAAQSDEAKAKAALEEAEKQAAQEKAALVANTPKASGKK